MIFDKLDRTKFYTYVWLREDGSPYYVGKGKGVRGFISHGHSVHRPVDPKRIIVREWDYENDAYEDEKRLISIYGRISNATGCLRNLTDGGRGNGSGYRHTMEARLKIAEAGRGRKFSAKSRQKISAAHIGRHFSREHRLALSRSHIGNTSHLGIKHSEETKRRVSEMFSGRPWTEARRNAERRGLIQ